MAKPKTSELYAHYHVERGDERRGLFEIARTEFGCESGLYPGCFVHVTPSFYIPSMVYVDSSADAARFFASGTAQTIIARGKTYDAPQHVEFHHQDYGKPIQMNEGSVDALISQYAGFVSEACKRYLRSGGVLIANNSHADAGLAGVDPDFELVAIVRKRGDRFALSTRDLGAYLTPKSSRVPTEPAALRAHLKERRRGVAYSKQASHYIFRKS